MTDTSFFTDLLNKALENQAYVLFGIGFILLSVFLGMLTRKDRKANPEKWARIGAAIDNQTNSTGSVIINGEHNLVTRAGNTTHIY